MSQKKIFFICPTNPQPSGGVKQIYRMVDTLNKNGFNAYVLHKKANQRETWFPNNTKVLYNHYIFKLLKYLDKDSLSFTKKIKLNYLKRISFKFDSDCILVFPEIFGPIHKIEPNVSKVIFNQNCYYTFNRFSLANNIDDFPYNNKSIIATITVSEDSQEYLQNAFTKQNVFRIRLGIDNDIFSFSDHKEKSIAFMPRKLSEDIVQIINIFKARNPDSEWNFISIDNKNELEVANILKSSTIFLSFNHKEGFGLPPVEAMSCGCFVIGYQGQAGKEYFKPEFSSAVQEGEIIDYVKKIEETIADFEKNPQQILLKGKAASDFVFKNYNTANEEKDILKIWDSII